MAKLSAYISSKFFRGTYTQDDMLQMLYAAKAAGKENYVPLGKLRGEGVSFETTINRSDDPEMAKREPSVLIVGKFEAINYETGEVKMAAGAYLPIYFRKMIVAQLGTGESANMAVEIGIELTGRTIPFAYCVSPLLKWQSDGLLQLDNAMKEEGIDFYARPSIAIAAPEKKKVA
jgi:hypothetical protein